MESNGKPNKIHVSQATADSLIAKNKNRWLTKREDAIEAKGKGRMITYWVEIMGATYSSTNKKTSTMHDEIESIAPSLRMILDDDEEDETIIEC